MKIGFDVSDLATNRADGTTRYTRALAERLPRLANDADWIYYAPSDFKLSNHENVKKRLAPWPKYWTQSRFPLELLMSRPDVLFMPIQQLPFMRSKKIKTVAVIHDLAFHMHSKESPFKDWLLLHAFTAYVTREADEIVAVSQSTADDIGKYYGRTNNVHVIHHGVDHDFFRPAEGLEREEGRDEIVKFYPELSSPYLLYVGQIQPRKNLERLIEAFEVIAEKDKDFQLVIAGSHGWLQQPIIDRTKKSKFADRILMPGRVSEELLLPLYWNAEVFVLPSLYEGFGMPVLEAMAAGCPVVTSDVSSMPEVAGGAAKLFNPASSEALIAAIGSTRGDREGMIKAGIARAQKFSWDITAKETMAVLR